MINHFFLRNDFERIAQCSIYLIITVRKKFHFIFYDVMLFIVILIISVHIQINMLDFFKPY